MSGRFNPLDPLRIGFEWQATSKINVPIDFGQELATRVVPATTTTLKHVDFFGDFPNVQSAGFSNRVLASVYEEGADQMVQQVFTERLAVAGGTKSPDAVYYGGAAALSDAFATPRDGRGVTLLQVPGAWVRPTFTLPSFPSVVNPRILDVIVELRVSGATVPGLLGVAWYFEGSGTWASIASLTNMPSDPDIVDTQVLIKNGETRFTSSTYTTLAPWFRSDFTALNSGVMKLYLTNYFEAMFDIEYIGLVVTYCEENRLAVGATPLNSPQLPAWYRVSLYDAQTGLPNGVSVSQGFPYLVTLTRATDSDCAYNARTTAVSTYYQAGPGVPLASLRPMIGAGFETFTIPRYSDGRIAGLPVSTDTGYAVVCQDATATPIASMSQPYYKISPSTAGVTTQTITTLQPGVYSHLTAVVKPQGNPGVLTFSIGSATATLTKDQFDVLETMPDGYALVTLPLSSPVNVSPTGTAFVTATTLTGLNRWLIPVASAGSWHATLDAVTYAGTTGQANSTNWWDAPITLNLAAPAVTGVVVTGGYISLDTVDPDCQIPMTSRYVSLSYVNLCWGNVPLVSGSPAITGAPLEMFCAWEVERRDAHDAIWRQIARVTDRNARCIQDFEARLNVASDYRIRLCRLDGVCGPWTIAAGWIRTGPSTSVAPTKTGGCDGIIFTSNENPALTVAYPYAFEGDIEEMFTFVEAETVTLQRLHMRDYQVAFKPLERGGVRFQRSMLVNALSVPLDRLDRKFLALRDIAWATISYVAVLDTRGNRWFATVIVPDGIVRNPPHVYIASVDIVEVTDRPSIIDMRAI